MHSEKFATDAGDRAHGNDQATGRHRGAEIELADGRRDQGTAQHLAAEDEGQLVEHGQRGAAEQGAVMVTWIGQHHVYEGQSGCRLVR